MEKQFGVTNVESPLSFNGGDLIPLVVYGTLKKGHGNHRLIRHAKFGGEVSSVEPMELVDLGAFPGAILSDEGKPVSGELYYIDEDTLKLTDRLEGNGSFYTRYLKTFVDEDNNEKKAWIYLLPDDDRYHYRRCDVNPKGEYYWDGSFNFH